MANKPEEVLDALLSLLKEKDCLITAALPLLSKTDQEKATYVNGVLIYNNLNNLSGLVKNSVKIMTRELPSPKPLLQTMRVVFHGKENKVKMNCNIIKEISSRKPDERGQWGVVINSFKLIK